MKRSMHTLMIRTAASMAALALPLLAFASDDAAIDGKTYTGTITKKGETQGDPDDFVFRDGKFISTACASFGFKPAAYTTHQDGKRLQFNAINETDNGVRMQWKGTIEGDHLDATADWMRPDQPLVQFRATAALKH